MNFRSSISLILAAALMAAGCMKENVPAGPTAPGHADSLLVAKTFTADAALTRCSISGRSVIWTRGDKIAIFDNIDPSQPRMFTLTAGEGTTSGTFEGEVAQGASTFVAVYPFSAADSCSVKDGILTATLPELQSLQGTNVAPDALLCTAKSENGRSFAMKNAFGYLEVDVTFDNITLIRLTGNDLAGTATFDAASGECSGIVAGSQSVTLTAQGGTIPTGILYIPVLPGTTPEGNFTVEMERTDGFTASRTSTKEIRIGRNGGTSLGALDADPEYHWSYHIATKADLMAWNGNSAVWKSNDHVYLDEDIDAEGTSWTAHPFAGSFFGQGHAIYNIICSGGGFFSDLSGSMGSLTFGSADGATWDGVSTISCGSGLCAGIAATTSGGASLSNVHNFAPVSGSGISSGTVCLGGIVGKAAGATDISLCTNAGPVSTSAGSSSSTNSYLGGILGNNSVEGSCICSCTNSAEVLCGVPTTGSSYIGGILGRSNTRMDISDCSNEGGVTIAANAGYGYSGGIVGTYSQGSTGSTLTGCINRGQVSIGTDAKVANSARTAGIIGDAYGKFTISGNINHGNVSNTSPSVKDVRLAGIEASNTSGAATVSSCVNYGNITSATSDTTAVTVGYCAGILAYKSSTKNTVSGCENYGTVTVSSGAGITKLYLSGIYAYSSSTGCTVSGCKSNCRLTGTGTTAYIGQAMGYGDSAVIKSTGIGGNVNGTTISKTNWKNAGILYGSVPTTTSGVNVSGDSASCYLLESTDSSLLIGDVSFGNDPNAW